MLEVIPVSNTNKWDEIIRSMHEYDFYHLSAYHKLEVEGEAILICCKAENNVFAFPFIQRKIPDTDYCDITSIYGYGGPLAKNKLLLEKDILFFQSELQNYFTENKIVSVFSRLHPLFFNQSEILQGLGTVVDTNKTVAVNLQLDDAQQRVQYSRSTRYRINWLKKQGVVTKEASSLKEIDVFIQIYEENMRRVQAQSDYFFSSEYFYSFVKNIDSQIILAYYNGEAVSGSLCTYCNSIMQAHLNATKTEFLDMSPLKLVLDRARIEGMKREMKWLHLGGGRAGKDDSLFEFKSRFSQERFIFKVWKYIHKREVYDSLVERKYGGVDLISSFFPLYRL